MRPLTLADRLLIAARLPTNKGAPVTLDEQHEPLAALATAAEVTIVELESSMV